MSLQGDHPLGDSATWNVVDDQTVETSRTLHAVRAMCNIIRHTGSGNSDVDPRGTTRGHPAGMVATGATGEEAHEEQCGEPSGGLVGFADITAEDEEEMVAPWTFAEEDQTRSPVNTLATPKAASRSTRSETHAEPEAEVATSLGTDMEIGSSDRRVRLRKERTDPHRESMGEPRGRLP